MRLILALCLILVVGPVLASPQDAVAAAVRDARILGADVRIQTRYFYTGNLPAAYRDETYRVLVYQANALSRSPELVKPRLIPPDLLAVVCSDYGPTWRKVWELLADHDPYFHVDLISYWPGGRWSGDGHFYRAGNYKVRGTAPWLPAAEMAELISLTQSRTPLVRADWWFVQTCRQLSLTNRQTGIGYYDWLGIKDRDTFERLGRLDAEASRDLQKETRAAVERSGVSAQNRQIVRLQALSGASWSTLDTDDSTGVGNAIRLLRPVDYRHKAEEHFLAAPNGLFYFLLCAADGSLQASAPDFIGGDDSPLRRGNDARIHVCLACLRCHTTGLQPIDDYVRRQPKTISSPDYAELQQLRRQYLSNLDNQLRRDREPYAEAVLEVTGWTPPELARRYAAVYNRFAVDLITPATAAAEYGISPVVLQARLRVPGRGLDPLAAGLLATPPVGIRRDQWEDGTFQAVAEKVYGK